MKRMRWQIMLLVLWLALVFNIERPNFDHGSTINLASFFYILVVTTVALLLVVPLRRPQLYLASLSMLAVYTVLKVMDPAPFFAGVHKYLTITEIVALLITTGLTWLVCQALEDFEQAVEAISLPTGRSSLLTYEDAQEHLRAEMRRARRYQRPFSVAMIKLDPTTFAAALHQAVRDVQAAMIGRYVQARVGRFLARRIRDSDVVAHHAESGRFLLLAPETAGEQAVMMLNRLSREVEDQMGIQLHYGIADFPRGALTSDELIRRASKEMQHGRVASDPTIHEAPPEPAEATVGATAYTHIPTANNGRNNGTSDKKR